MAATYHLAVDYGDGLESTLTWVTTEANARRYFELNRREYSHPTALVDGAGRIIARG